MRWIAPLLLLLCLLGLTGCGEDASQVSAVSLRTATVIERQATLSILKRAWAERPRVGGDEQMWQERRLLNRLGIFGKKILRTETHRAAARFWLECLREHEERYGR